MSKKYFDLKVGFMCNNDCVHCVITDKKETKDLTTQEIKDVIDTLDKDYIVGFTGGEATIRKDFIELVNYAKDAGHNVALQTNGTSFSNREFSEELAGKIDSVLIAIHSHLPEIHDKIVRREGMYDRTIKGFLNLIDLEYDVITQTVISNYNIKDLPKTYDFIQFNAPGTFMNLTYPHPNGNAFHNAKEILPRLSDIKPQIQEILSKYATFINTEAIPICYLYPYQDRINFNVDEDIMNPKSESIHAGMDPANAIESNKLFDDRGRIDNYRLADLSEKRKGPLCRKCVFASRCPGVWKEYVHFFKDRFDLYPIIKE